MSRTIEEAAREAVMKEYLCEKCAWKENCDFCGGENTAFDCCECPADSYEDGFKAGTNHVYGLPLSQRLTDAEEEMVRTKYNAAKIAATECDSPECAEFMDMLENLFGKDFFKEDKL